MHNSRNHNRLQDHGAALSGSHNHRLMLIARNRVMPAALAAVLALTPAGMVNAKTISQLQNEKSQTQSQLSAAQGQASALAGQQQALEGEMDVINDDIITNMASVKMLEETIADLDIQIAQKQKEYDAAKAEEEKRYTAMKKRIKYMYEQGNATYVQIMMKASSFSDLLNKAGYVEELYEYDRRLLNEYQEIQRQVAEVQAELEAEKSDQEASKIGLEEEQKHLNEQLDALEEQYGDISEQIASAQAKASQLAAQLNAQTKAISAAIEAQAQEEARRREEEAKRAAEVAAQQAAERAKEAAERLAAANAASTETAEAEKATKSEESKTEETEESKTEESKTEETKAEQTKEEETQEVTESEPAEETTTKSSSSSTPARNSNGVSGQDVVNYASQFVGNPYVYGGSSLTNGTDCSGFTMAVYQHFGYSLPHYDVGQRSVGIAVDSIEDAQPGDLICYPGHVGIYAGNGTIVHASTPATGIKYSSVTYRSYVCIRRLIY